MIYVPERTRRAVASALQWGGWGGSLFLLIWGTINYDPAEGKFAPAWLSLGFIFLIGVAIAGTTARSRMRITDTIVQAFEAGYDASEDRRAQDVLRQARQVRHDKDG